MSILVVGIGMGPQHVTPEAAAALRTADYVIAARKAADDQLLAVRREVANAHGLEVVEVEDPERDRSAQEGPCYDRAVREWHQARVAAYRRVLDERGGTAAFLVWGDPALYDSTIRIVQQLDPEYDVVAGISAPQLLAARHRVVLHEVGRPVHITTARRLRADIEAGQTNLVVMLGGALDLAGLEDWSIWWGANLGAESEQLVAGRVGDVLPELVAARDRAKAAAGWVMDVYLLRAPADLSTDQTAGRATHSHVSESLGDPSSGGRR